MRTYLSNLIPQLKEFSKQLDNHAQLVDKHWVSVDELGNTKTVYIFRSSSELLISKNGQVTKGKWDYVGNNSVLIDIGEESFLFKQGFFDENILALKIDSANEYAFLVNEAKYSTELASAVQIENFLKDKYLVKNLPNSPQPAPQRSIQPNLSYNQTIRTTPVKPDWQIKQEEEARIKSDNLAHTLSNIWGIFLLVVMVVLTLVCVFGALIEFKNPKEWFLGVFYAAIAIAMLYVSYLAYKNVVK